jgi:hypothetical protein
MTGNGGIVAGFGDLREVELLDIFVTLRICASQAQVDPQRVALTP